MSGFSAPFSGANAGCPSFQSDTWRCIELPESLLNGFAMNVALTPSRRAISRTPYLSRTPWSAAASASSWARLTSHWPGPYSTLPPSSRTKSPSPSRMADAAGSRSFAFCSE